jgi:uncharacterized DUF497 family protein
MEFEWSEAKRLAVLEARGLDFIRGRRLFDGRGVYTISSPRDAEERWITVGELDGRIIAVVWTQRDNAIRIITMRRAHRAEERRHRSLYG